MDTRFLQPCRHKAASLALVAALLLSSCTRTIYVPQVETRTEYRDKVAHDTTIIERERVEKVADDTIYIEVSRNVYRVSIQRDTISRTDTLYVEREVVKVEEVERKKTRFESFTQGAGIIATGVLLVLFLWRVREVSRQLRN